MQLGFSRGLGPVEACSPGQRVAGASGGPSPPWSALATPAAGSNTFPPPDFQKFVVFCFEVFIHHRILAFVGELLWTHEVRVVSRPPRTRYSDIMVPWRHPKVAPWYHLGTILRYYADAMFLLHYGAVLLQQWGTKSVSVHEAMKIEF